MQSTRFPSSLTLKDRIISEIMLDVELEIQDWCIIVCSGMILEEVAITLQ